MLAGGTGGGDAANTIPAISVTEAVGDFIL
jgi:hypothetical protein